MAGAVDLEGLGERVCAELRSGMRLGLGTGRAASAFLRALARRVAGGLDVTGVPTSESTRRLAVELGVPLASLADLGELDVAVDGADEIDPRLCLVKGLGGALVREKIVAASARELWVVAGEEKLVERLGARAPVPVEIVPFGRPLAERRLAALGAEPRPRLGEGGRPFVTDNGNEILDCRFAAIDDPAALDEAIGRIPGVVGSGLFVGLAARAFVAGARGVRVLEPR